MVFSRSVETKGDEMGFGPLPGPLARATRDSMMVVGLALRAGKMEERKEE